MGREGEGIENWTGRERVTRVRVWVGVRVRKVIMGECRSQGKGDYLGFGFW